MFVIGTAGHVDHGKSLLVEALTGIDPDRLREEKARGMTIDLGFAWLTLPSGRAVSIVDVPGHERFIKNMLAGAGGVDVALLVVAADDGVMPQTREHLAILDLLGVTRGVVALTKCDLADEEWREAVERDVAETLAGTTLEGSPVVACSSVTGHGLDEVRRALDTAVDALPPKRDIGRPRLPIDRVFTIGGFGTVVTGTLIDGTLDVGAEVEAAPVGLIARVRGLQNHREPVERALPGTRTAVNLSGAGKRELARGMVLALPGTLAATDVVDARVRAVAPLARPLRHNLHLTLHVHAAEANAQLRLLDTDELRAGDEAWAQIKLDAPVAVVKGDRFILRTADDTVAGGTIVGTAPKRHRRQHGPTLAALAALLSDAPEDDVLEAIARRPGIERGAVATAAALSADHAVDAIESLIGRGEVLTLGDGGDARLITARDAAGLREKAVATLAAHHAAHHLRDGVPLEELRQQLGADPGVLAALLAGWDDVRATTTTVALRTHVPLPTASEQAQIDAYLRALGGQGAAPNGALAPELARYLVGTGAIVDAGGIVFGGDAFRAMTDAVRAHIAAHGAITLAQARDLLGTGRKQAQAVLEEMDRRRVTRRVGDERVLW
jgi:selenocysteine-specific elongation factor